MEEEIQRLKHENAYLHRQIREMQRQASDYAWAHIENYTMQNGFLEYNTCNNIECDNDDNVDWFKKKYYCCKDCESVKN